MIQAYVGDLVVLGLTRKNIDKLTAGQAVKLTLQKPVNTVFIVFGEDKPAIIRELEAKGGVQFEAAHKAAAAADPL